jgi:hypothetical protein
MVWLVGRSDVDRAWLSAPVVLLWDNPTMVAVTVVVLDDRCLGPDNVLASDEADRAAVNADSLRGHRDQTVSNLTVWDLFNCAHPANTRNRARYGVGARGIIPNWPTTRTEPGLDNDPAKVSADA